MRSACGKTNLKEEEVEGVGEGREERRVGREGSAFVLHPFDELCQHGQGKGWDVARKSLPNLAT